MINATYAGKIITHWRRWQAFKRKYPSAPSNWIKVYRESLLRVLRPSKWTGCTPSIASKQVALIGLENTNDRLIRQYAIDNGYVIVTQDADFYDMNLVRQWKKMDKKLTYSEEFKALCGVKQRGNQKTKGKYFSQFKLHKYY